MSRGLAISAITCVVTISFLAWARAGLERVEFGVDAAQFGSGVVGEEIIQQALVLFLVALRFVLGQDVADRLVQRQRFGVGECQRAIVDAQAADVALERLVVVRIADRRAARRVHARLCRSSSHARGFAIEQKLRRLSVRESSMRRGAIVQP